MSDYEEDQVYGYLDDYYAKRKTYEEISKLLNSEQLDFFHDQTKYD